VQAELQVRIMSYFSWNVERTYTCPCVSWDAPKDMTLNGRLDHLRNLEDRAQVLFGRCGDLPFGH